MSDNFRAPGAWPGMTPEAKRRHAMRQRDRAGLRSAILDVEPLPFLDKDDPDDETQDAHPGKFRLPGCRR